MGLVGAVLGLLLGTFGVYYGCVLSDKLSFPNGVPPGGGLIALSWVLMFFTAPVGVILGGTLGVLGMLWRLRKAEKSQGDETARPN